MYNQEMSSQNVFKEDYPYFLICKNQAQDKNEKEQSCSTPPTYIDY